MDIEFDDIGRIFPHTECGITNTHRVMIGYGDTAGSGFPTILAAWAEKGWPEPELEEDTILNQVTLTLRLGSNAGVEMTPNTTPNATSKDDAIPSN